MTRLNGKSALITGAARGIGRGFAEKYLEEGATVAIADINLDAAETTAAQLGKGAYAVPLDVTDQTSIGAALAQVVAKTGKIDILLNNAALFDAAETVDITRESYERLYAVNVAGTLFTMQAAARQMIAQGHGGKIINMASQAGRRGESLVFGLLFHQGGRDFHDAIGWAELDQIWYQCECHRPRGRGWGALGTCGCYVCQIGGQGAGSKENRGRRGRASRPFCGSGRSEWHGGFLSFRRSGLHCITDL